MSSQAPSASRARNPRKKVNEDASYIGPSGFNSAGSKRQAADRADGEPRAKRKRVSESANAMLAPPPRVAESETRPSKVDFGKMSTAQLHRYLSHYELVPVIRPSPLTHYDPPPPYSLADPHAHRADSRPPSPPPPHITPANRPRRDHKDQSRRRSSRLLDDESFLTRTPILHDVGDVHMALASLAERHFREKLTISGREEVDTLASFMCAIEKLKVGRPQ
ncbi:hypothetical protein D9758_001094 [Tetrapyrgos nigripes]|uniref:Histone deacetylase complex subunit SAP30 Sin3 binding domain-containing protein n=1 Tax=Tetrapyrgos nigripes TaxID=182062 RepID=A0A8H5GRC2_9AGAR|nr:hypothetical protein D9758_001094 [Tetrapyrgos nigripes]